MAARFSAGSGSAVPYTSGMSRLSRITSDPEVCHGKPTVRGLRYPVADLLQLLGNRTRDPVLVTLADGEDRVFVTKDGDFRDSHLQRATDSLRRSAR